MTRTYALKPVADETPDPVFTIDYEAELNPAQFEAVCTLHGPVLCIAGAGSGKTKTLVYRVARMIESRIAPDSILLLTFTRKAANQMLSRVARLVGDRGGKVAGGTYHSFANIVLRRYGQQISIPNSFSILDDADSGDILNLARTELELNTAETRFPLKKTLKDILSKTVNLALPLEEVMKREYPHFLEHTDGIARTFDYYRDYKRKNNLLDYDDLLTMLLRLLEESPETREKLADRYSFLMADEYQDTNLIQARITELLGKKHRNVMVVGDDAQSIYSFRGARFKNIHEFQALFPQTKVIKLEQNYRSTASILAATNHLMTHAVERLDKTLFSRHHEGDKPALIACADEEEQSTFVAQRILELREEGIPLSKIAVLFRSGFHAFQLEIELKRRNIPYVKWGGFKFLEAAHIKDVIAHLRVLYNPRDLVSWQRVLLLIEGVGTKSIAKLNAAIQNSTDPFCFDSLPATPRMKPGLKKLETALQKAVPFLTREPQSLLECITDYYGPLAKEIYDDYPKRLRDLDHLAIISGKYATVQDLLTDFALEPPTNSSGENLATDDEKENTLVLSTIHSAKGLEWHSVFLIWALEGRFPSANAAKSAEALEEERRLMYVALTRAGENLFITYPARFWDPIVGETLSRPSRFIEEIGPEFLETWRLTR